MNDSELLTKYGLPSKIEFRGELIKLLKEEISKHYDQESDSDILRCLITQLFSIGKVEDSLLIWKVKNLSFDLMCGMDIQFLCGAGLENTISYLESMNAEESKEALNYIKECVESGDFNEWSPESWLEYYKGYYGIK